VVRATAKGAVWKGSGCEVALADMNDAAALTPAFTGVDGVFVLIPPNFDPTPGFPETALSLFLDPTDVALSVYYDVARLAVKTGHPCEGPVSKWPRPCRSGRCHGDHLNQFDREVPNGRVVDVAALLDQLLYGRIGRHDPR